MSRRTGWEPQRADMHAGTKQEWERRPGWCTYQRVRRTGIVDKSARSTVFTDSASWENLGDVGIQQDSDRPRMRTIGKPVRIGLRVVEPILGLKSVRPAGLLVSAWLRAVR